MASDALHRHFFYRSEVSFHNAEHTVANAVNDKAGGRDCVGIYQSLHYMAVAVGDMKENLAAWEKGGDFRGDLPEAKKTLRMAEDTLAALQDKFKRRCVKVN